MRAFRLWTLPASLAIHAGLLALLLHVAAEHGAQEMGVGGVEVALSPAGRPAGGIAAVEIPAARTPEPVEAARPSQTNEAATPAPPEMSPAPPEQAEPVVPDVAQAAPAPEAATPAAEEADVPPDMSEAPAAPAESAPPMAPEEAPPAPPPDTARPSEIAQAPATEPDDASSREAAIVPPAPPKPAPPGDSPPTAAPSAPTATAASDPGAGGRAGAGEEQAAGSDSGGAGGGEPGVSPNYLDILRAWLERHKEYPRQARLRRHEGTALLRFVIDRDGQVLSYRIERSSGHASLDAAVEAMLERARPLPGLPPDMAQTRLELSLPVTFELR